MEIKVLKTKKEMEEIKNELSVINLEQSIRLFIEYEVNKRVNLEVRTWIQRNDDQKDLLIFDLKEKIKTLGG